MFIPFLAAAAIATALIKLGALSAWVTVLSLALKTVTMSEGLLTSTLAPIHRYCTTLL